MQKILKISQQTLWQAIFKVVTTTGGFIILGIVSRKYGESGLGSFTLALTYLAFFYILADFGFNGYILNRLQVTPRQDSGQAGYRLQLEWRKLLGVRIIWGLILTFLAVILPFIFTPHLLDFNLAVLIGVITIFLNSLFFCAQALIQVKLKYEYSLWPVFLSTPAGVFLIFYLSGTNSPVYLLTAGYVLSWIVYTAVIFLLVKKLISSLSPIFDKNYTTNLFKGSLPLAGTLTLNILYFRIDAFILSYYQNISSVGIYNLAYQIFQAVLVFPTYIMNAFYPFMLETFKFQISNFQFQIKNAAVLLGLVSILLSLITYHLSPFIIRIITGSGFSESVTSLQILSFGFPAYFLSALLMWVMVTKKMYKQLLLVYGLGLIVNIVANLIFIPQYSYLAASWVTGISEYLILAMQLLVLYRFPPTLASLKLRRSGRE